MKTIRRSLKLTRSVDCLWRTPAATRGYRTAVSLHSHTVHSRESLDFIPRVLRKVPLIHALVAKASERRRARCGRAVDFDRAFWRPPLNAVAAHSLEAAQIADLLGLRPLISITDHDDLEACAELRTLGIPAPFSLEWTLPYRGAVFHIGVHNLPPERARAFHSEMARYTAAPEPGLLASLLAELDRIPNVLIVLNHPFSCELRTPRAFHIEALRRFLAAHGARIHALELNGLQPANDNRATIHLAAELGLPVISGGDRHCLEPNANLNLTNAASLDEFIDEIRRGRMTRVLFLPQYREPLAARYIEFIWHAVKPYPGSPGREHWMDRVFYEHETGGLKALSAFWPNGGPWALRQFIGTVGWLAQPQVRATLRLALGWQEPTGV
ncbi:MAG: PHP domain-containing protein [Bryobacteraceae bacterium]